MMLETNVLLHDGVDEKGTTNENDKRKADDQHECNVRRDVLAEFDHICVSRTDEDWLAGALLL